LAYVVVVLLVAAMGTAGVEHAVGVDTQIYWLNRPPDPYLHSTYAVFPAFSFSPAFAQALAPLTSALPLPVFGALWLGLMLAILWLLVGRWSLVSLLLPPLALELQNGNVHLLLAAVAVLGLRWPGLWSFALLTKITPGIGLLW